MNTSIIAQTVTDTESIGSLAATGAFWIVVAVVVSVAVGFRRR
jgi:hypothetical protein